MIARLAFLAAFLPIAFAFSDTHPIVAWSSHDSSSLASPNIASPVEYKSFLESILLNDAVCEHDAVILVDQEGLHASDLRSLPSSSELAKALTSAPSSIQLPYVRNLTFNPFPSLGNSISERCGSTIIVGDLQQVEAAAQESTNKNVLCMTLSTIEGTSNHRKLVMTEEESLMTSTLDALSILSPNYLVVYAGWASVSSSSASLDDEITDVPLLFGAALAPSNSTLPEGGILKRYQLLTPGLILSLLVAFFVLVPIVILGVSALAGIQSSVRMDAPKGFNAQERKNQ